MLIKILQVGFSVSTVDKIPMTGIEEQTLQSGLSVYMMEHSQVEVIAAADGNYWTNTMVRATEIVWVQGSGLTANTIVFATPMVHERFTLTWKQILWQQNIGRRGFFRRIPGSCGGSGSSGGPHLHFEVWSGSSMSTLVDPFGLMQFTECKFMVGNTKPYTETEVIKASVHTTDISFPPCPTTEIPIEWHFSIPFFRSRTGAGLREVLHFHT